MLQSDRFDTRPKVKKNKLNILPDNPEVDDSTGAVGRGRFPSWLHRKLPKGGNLKKTGNVISDNRLHTVCEEAKCPNLLECWSKKTATFLIMGKECTRACGFCDIDFNKAPKPLEADEPERVADSVKKLGLKHVVITMVARDDLPNQGAEHIVNVIEAVRGIDPSITVEVLTSDFQGDYSALDIVLNARPEIFNHNLETVRALTHRVRNKATYDRSLQILRHAHAFAKEHGMFVKSGLMLGLGETQEQVEEAIRDLHSIGCDIITMGQYLQPNHKKLLVKEFITPALFKHYEEYGYRTGVKQMYCGPFIRSSYNADMVIEKIRNKG
ncbi:MAG: lipoyl synthase [Chlamydiales bacterium]|nr:lipoyl synthase [Chlamydiia bacterium]MCP5507919.1 lipoyl synthase [Chlamydiales bacterium]